jgi:SAM-dependent methyltransferase
VGGIRSIVRGAIAAVGAFVSPGNQRSRGTAGHGPVPRVGRIDFGDLRRLQPISRRWGFDRGRPVDRYYIEQFLQRNASDIRGRVLEVGDSSYTRRFGGAAVERSDVLHIQGGHPGVTVVADLTEAEHVPGDAFDCIILTQTLHLVYDMRAAMRTLHRILRPGGVLLLTVPGISQMTDNDWRSSWYWSLTTHSVSRLANDVFGAESCTVESHGNVLAAIAFLQGIPFQELTPEELAYDDADFPVTIALRAWKDPAQTGALPSG